MMLPQHIVRELAAGYIERLIAFLDALDSDPDLEPECREDDPAGSGIGDMDGMLEQLAELTVRTATTQLQAIRMIHDHDGCDPTAMLHRFVDTEPRGVTGRSLAVLRK